MIYACVLFLIQENRFLYKISSDNQLTNINEKKHGDAICKLELSREYICWVREACFKPEIDLINYQACICDEVFPVPCRLEPVWLSRMDLLC